MATYPSFKDISLNSIRVTPHYNIHPFLEDSSAPPALKQSFEESGILHPLIVQQAPNGTFELICGRKRLHALKHHFKQTFAPCLIIPADCDPYAFFLYILTDQQVHGLLTPMEAAFFLKYCLQKIDEKEAINFFLPRLGYKQQSTILHQVIRLLTLDENIQRQIHHGFISDKIAFELLDLPPEDRSSLSKLFELLQPGTGKQKRILLLSREIAQRSQQTITTLFEEQEFQYILEHTEMNAPQKVHSILELLQKKFYPQSSDAEQIFKDRVRILNLPEGYQLTHSLNFEKDAVNLTVTFPNLGSFEKAWQRKELFVE
ncbi:MAG: ParB N-terminal domain-containing protein [Desulfocapsaceae bacterium]|nr:ParB N-terminal domain-containing protein [Desulfocapsaceae bacterium]